MKIKVTISAVLDVPGADVHLLKEASPDQLLADLRSNRSVNFSTSVQEFKAEKPAKAEKVAKPKKSKADRAAAKVAKAEEKV